MGVFSAKARQSRSSYIEHEVCVRSQPCARYFYHVSVSQNAQLKAHTTFSQIFVFNPAFLQLQIL
jgi:hypothetical protein